MSYTSSIETSGPRIRRPLAVVLSGGAELVSLYVAQALWEAGIPFVVISLVEGSLLQGIAGSIDFLEIDHTGLTEEAATTRLAQALDQYRNRPDTTLVIFPTEDYGLGLLHRVRNALDADFLAYSRARRLQFGGLDKLELFEFLSASDSADLSCATRVLDSPAELTGLLHSFAPDLVIKPAAKRLGGSIDPNGAKAFTVSRSEGNLKEVRRKLERIWELDGPWVVQPRLEKFPEGEISVCMVRGSTINAVQVAELIKHPAHAGTACAVRSMKDRSLIRLAGQIAEEVDLVGMCELTFLKSLDGKPKLIELNTRPWLQIGLMEHIGFPIVEMTFACLSEHKMPPLDPEYQTSALWVQPERLLEAITRQRWRVARSGISAWRALLAADCYGGYSFRLPMARRRWALRVASLAWRRISKWASHRS